MTFYQMRGFLALRSHSEILYKSTASNSKCVRYSPYIQAMLPNQLGVLKFNSILTLSTRRQHHIPQVESSVPTRLPLPSDTNSKLRLCTCTSEPLAIKSEVPLTSCLTLINLLEQLTKHRKPVYSLNDQFITRILEDTNQQPDEKKHRAKSLTKELPPLWNVGLGTVTCVNCFWFTNLEAL